MAFIDRVKAAGTILFGTSQNNSIGNKLNEAIYSFFSGYFYTLTTNKKTYVDSGYKGNLDVYSIVKLIASKTADAKFKGVRYSEQKDEYLDLPKSHWVNKLLKRPNELERQQGFIEALASWLLITGDLYLYKIVSETDKGRVLRLYSLPSQYVQIIGGGAFDPEQGYKMIIGDQSIEFTKEEVVHIKYFNPNWDISGSQLYGQSPLEAALSTVQSSNEAVNAKIKAFINGGMHGLLSSKDPNAPVSVEQISQLNEIIDSRVTGTNNTKKISATSGMVEYTQIGMSPADLEILKSIQFDADKLCKVFGVSPYLFNTESSSYNNVKEAKKSLVTDVVTPLLNLIIDALDDCLNSTEYDVMYDISHFPELQEDLGQMVNSLKDAYWLTPNEKREQMGLEPIEDEYMGKVLVPSNLVPIDEMSIDVNLGLSNNGDF